MNHTFVLENGFLIDGAGGEPIPGAVVVVSEGRIREVRQGEYKGNLKDAVRVDLKGKTIMPGLIDAHVHIGNIELSLAKTAALSPAVFVHKATRNLETDLALGYTTIRDATGLDPSFKEAVNLGLINGPRVLLSINALVQSGGGSQLNPLEPERPQARNSLGVYPEVCDGPDAVRRAARRVLGRGADQIKIFADGEVVAQNPSDRAMPGQWKFTVEEIRAAVETAEAAGSYVMAHTYGSRAVMNCLKAGVRSIEHANLIDEQTVQEMAKSGAFYVPTLTVYDIVRREHKDELDAFTREKLEFVGNSGMAVLEAAHRAGVRIASGSDIIGPLQRFKGRELAIKAEVMGPMGAIVSATKTNAELLKLDDSIGTVEPGKLADLIVVDGNPFEDISVFESGLERVRLVMREGRICKNLGVI